MRIIVGGLNRRVERVTIHIETLLLIADGVLELDGPPTYIFLKGTVARRRRRHHVSNQAVR